MLKYKPKHFEQVHCNQCAHQTRHERRHIHIRKDSELVDGYVSSWRVTYEVFECCGCEDTTMRVTSVDSEGPIGDLVIYYPPRIARAFPVWMIQVEDKDIVGLFDEVYTALHAHSLRLALMGCRAILDRVMQAQLGSDGSFQWKLEEMQARNLISAPNREVLAAAIDAGNAAAHRGYLPEPEDLDLVVGIVENVVQATLLHGAAQRLRESTPPRKPSKKRKS